MEENPEDIGNDFEYEPESQQQPAVAVAPNPIPNGTAAHANGQAGQVLNRQITEKYTVSTPLMGRVNNRPAYAPEKKKEKDDREFLDNFNLKADAIEYQLSATRYLPASNDNGDPVPTGITSRHTMPCMSFDELRQTISEVWGGGSYRVGFLDEKGQRAENVDRCILINIPTTETPPKQVKYEKIEPLRSGKSLALPIHVDPADEEEKERGREFKRMEAEERRQDAVAALEMKRAKRELQRLQQERDMAIMRQEITSPKKPESTQKPIELMILEKRLEDEKLQREAAERRYADERAEERRRYEDDKKETQRRYDDDRKMMMDGLTKLSEGLREVATRPAPTKDNTMETLFATMAPVLTAIISRPQLPPPDNKEVLLAMGEIQRSSMQTLTTALSKPEKPDNSSEKMFDAMMKLSSRENSTQNEMVKGLMAAFLNKSGGNELTADVIFKLQDKMEQRFERLAGLGNGQSIGGEGGEEGDGYDPALGFLGNAGKAIFTGLKGLVDSAATNPQLMELAMRLIGSRNPTNQQLAQVAHRMEMEQGGVPPTIQYNPAPALPQYAPTNQQAIPYPPPMAPQRAMPPPMPAQNPSQPPAASPQPPMNAQQQSVANDLEGESSGLPSNGDPEPQVPLTPEELANENLVDAVTRTVEIMIGEARGKPGKRTWPEDATDHWNRDFIKQIVDNPYQGQRLQLIGSKCDAQVAANLNAIWNSDRSEQQVFWNELNRFVDMNLPKLAPTAPAPAVPPLPVTPAPVAPPVAVNPIA